MSTLRYLGPNGEELTMNEWAELLERRTEDMSPESWWRRETLIGDVRVSTVWLGLNHQFLDDLPPLYWETMIFGGDHDQEQWRYSSRQEALDDHERIVRALRAGKNPE